MSERVRKNMMIPGLTKIRCEHNCRLCKKEWLGRCHGPQYGKDVSLEGITDVPVCSDYIYGGTEKHLKEIECAENLGVGYLYIEDKKFTQDPCIWSPVKDLGDDYKYYNTSCNTKVQLRFINDPDTTCPCCGRTIRLRE